MGGKSARGKVKVRKKMSIAENPSASERVLTFG